MTARPIASALTALCLCLTTSSGWADAPPTSRPSPDDPGAISWSTTHWSVAIGASVAGEIAGVVGSVALFWSLTDACAQGQSVGDCFEDNPFSTASVAFLLGAPLGASLAASMAGAGMGFEGSYWGALAGASAGSLMLLSGFGSPAVDPEEGIVVGMIVAALAIPIGAAAGYYLSQESAVRIGDGNALLQYDPEGGLGFGLPAVGVAPIDGALGVVVPIATGRF